jgi:FlaA1/EpsC-like NDP-sugar epimerase
VSKGSALQSPMATGNIQKIQLQSNIQKFQLRIKIFHILYRIITMVEFLQEKKEIPDFYANQIVLVTGATGFLGKVIT